MTAIDFLLEKITLKKLEHDVYLYPRVTNEDIEKAKEMESDFIIKFADWVNVNAYKYPTKTTTSELLLIFKKPIMTPKEKQIVVEVLDWLTNEKSDFSIMYGNQNERFSSNDKDYTIDEIIEIYKNQL
jgi:hypothetical protein